ncbi:hypothetical protein V6N12_045826 [Hibiscus sabdariffa]|uniref:Disease resistance protein At4g27190-like leucine-rich repeats domain-containing protein n=1 Tax=Hibiscus sabdariffa TaxID=183260 RepID=A0ABR2G3V1_9ROSI
MTVSELKNMKMMLHNHLALAAGSFGKLKEMGVENCDELLTISSSTALAVFHCLEELQVKCCNSLEQIFESEKSISNVNSQRSCTTGRSENKGLWGGVEEIVSADTQT